MSLCVKCRKNSATVHLTALVGGAVMEKADFCKACAPSDGFANLDPEKLKALYALGKECMFCGRPAVSGTIGSAQYWCFDCGMELGQIFAELCASERPELMQRNQEESSFLALCFDPELLTWTEEANRKAEQTLRERRRQDGRDKGN
jgi:ribosomal protein L24E